MKLQQDDQPHSKRKAGQEKQDAQEDGAQDRQLFREGLIFGPTSGSKHAASRMKPFAQKENAPTPNQNRPSETQSVKATWRKTKADHLSCQQENDEEHAGTGKRDHPSPGVESFRQRFNDV